MAGGSSAALRVLAAVSLAMVAATPSGVRCRDMALGTIALAGATSVSWSSRAERASSDGVVVGSLTARTLQAAGGATVFLLPQVGVGLTLGYQRTWWDGSLATSALAVGPHLELVHAVAKRCSLYLVGGYDWIEVGTRSSSWFSNAGGAWVAHGGIRFFPVSAFSIDVGWGVTFQRVANYEGDTRAGSFETTSLAGSIGFSAYLDPR